MHPPKELRNFGLIFSFILVFWGGYLLYSGQGILLVAVFFGGGLAIGLAALFWQDIILPIYRSVIKLSQAISWVLTHLVLCFLYYLVVTAVGFAGKFSKKRFLNLSKNKDVETYWQFRTKKHIDLMRAEKQY